LAWFVPFLVVVRHPIVLWDEQNVQFEPVWHQPGKPAAYVVLSELFLGGIYEIDGRISLVVCGSVSKGEA
jgi:hypothetical protein